ncbi:uncharacterized protein FFB20_04684 [Fusarium fujikuroi]|nr:uncharacterized protein FFB20_04684 [Fusarium fujikuroi]SCN89701.1 uncharacterized protein FFC1_05821 [Fusarium fujikuroi]SCN93939.1 uncharacterized protein FFE2_07913 [Fusarium fujikuroi]SCO41602.1 uncharacterized protein FFNC_08033 [Fusarium fujikuroi]SCV33205.1 uncharacterized protein FFFS_03671 [Fusarium fujikuroi]
MAQDIVKWLPRRLLEKLALRATKLNKTLVGRGTDISKWKLLDNTPSLLSATTFIIKEEAAEHALYGTRAARDQRPMAHEVWFLTVSELETANGHCNHDS